MPTIDDERPTAANFQRRLDFETLIFELSSRFINLNAGEVGREVEDAPRRICELLDIDLAILWQRSEAAPDFIGPTHVYHADDIPRPSEPMRQDQYPWTRQQMLAGRVVVVPAPEALPVEASVDRETCRRFGIKSAIALPLAVGGEAPIGALGLNCLRAPRDWPDVQVRWLQLAAQVFTNALARERREQRLLDSQARRENVQKAVA